MHQVIGVALQAVIGLTFSFSAYGQLCSFSLSPTNQATPLAGGNFTISITASAASCSRTVTSSVPWITISFGQTGTGSGSAGYTVLANNTDTQRTGTINVAGVVFTVTQAAGTCSYTLNPLNASAPATGGSGTFSVLSGCSWTATSGAAWVRITRGQGTGDGTVEYSVEAYTGATERTGTITVGTSTFTIRQTAAACVFTTTGTVQVPASGGTASIQVQAREGCTRIASADADWITITSGSSGDGSGTIAITVAANAARVQRVGHILINGSRFVDVIQAASTCVIQLNPRNASMAANGGSLSFAVTANCAWTAVSQNSWITVTGGATGNGSGNVTYAVGQNFEANPRGGAIAVNGETFVVSQAGASCDVYLSDTIISIPAEGGGATVKVNSLAGCNWTVSVSDDWIRVTKNGSGGTGIDEVTFTVAVNPANRERRGSILIGGKPVEIRQAAARCTLTIERSRAQIQAEGARGELGVTANCSWTAAANVGWIQITGTTQTLLTYSVSPNDSENERTGVISVSQADPPERQTFTLSQSGQRCSVTLSAAAGSLPSRGGNGTVAVRGSTPCWSAVSSADWLKVEWSSVSGSGNVRFFAEPNTTGADRTAVIAVSGQTITVQQPAVRLRITEAGVLNAASFTASSVAPGEIITIFGTGFGPEAVTGLQPGPDGTGITNALAGTRVLFNGDPAPMVYALDGQLSAIVPYAVETKQTAEVQIEYLGVRSNSVTLRVSATAPGIFTLAATGRGQAAVLNQDFTVNGAANAAPRGSIIQIFATGEGQTRPAGVDGRLAEADPYPVPVLPVRVFIGGIEASVAYAGGAPGLVAGLIQVNARIPDEVQRGTDVPVVIRVGTADSPAGPTIAVR